MYVHNRGQFEFYGNFKYIIYCKTNRTFCQYYIVDIVLIQKVILQ